MLEGSLFPLDPRLLGTGEEELEVRASDRAVRQSLFPFLLASIVFG